MLLLLSLILFLRWSIFWDTLLLWFLMSIMFYAFYDVKEKYSIYARTLLIGMLAGMTVFLHTGGWALTLLGLSMLVVWTVLSFRTFLIFMLGWSLPLVYAGSILFFQDTFQQDYLILSMNLPNFSVIPLQALLGGLIVFLLFNFIFWSFVVYKISTRHLLFNFYIAFTIGLIWFMFGGIKEGIIFMSYPFWLVYNKALEYIEKTGWFWFRTLLPILIFWVFFVFFKIF
jgi:hypothetical protein